MAPSHCPHCQALLPADSGSFCGACGRKIEGWTKAPSVPQAPGALDHMADGAARTLKTSISTEERKALQGKSAAAVEALPPGDTVKLVPPSTKRTTDKQDLARVSHAADQVNDAPDDAPDDANVDATGRHDATGDLSSELEAVRAQGPRLLGIVVLALGAGTIAAGLGFFVYRHFVHVVPPRSRVEVNLDAPAASPPPASQSPSVTGGKRRRRKGSLPTPATVPSTVARTAALPPQAASHTAPASSPAPVAAATPASGATLHPPASSAVSPSAPAATARTSSTKTAAPIAPPAIEMPPDDGDEAGPLSDEELREQEQGRAVADGIVFVLRSHRSQVTACYERAFKAESSPRSARVDIEFTVDSAGKAKKIHTARDTSGSDQLAPCLENLLGQWQFPRPPSGDFATSYPFVFSGAS